MDKNIIGKNMLVALPLRLDHSFRATFRKKPILSRATVRPWA